MEARPVVIDYSRAVKELSAGNLWPVYLVCGSEAFFQDLFVTALINRVFPPGSEAAMDLNYLRLDAEEEPLEKALAAAETYPLLSERRFVLVKHSQEFSGGKAKKGAEVKAEEAEEKKEKDEAAGGMETAVLRYLASPAPSSVLVFLVRGPADRRRRAFKALDRVGLVVDCGRLRESEIPSWVRQRVSQLGGRIRPEAAEVLASRAGCDLTMADSEIRKLIAYRGEEEVRPADVELLVSGLGETSIFRLLDALGARRPREAATRMMEMIEHGEPPVRILFMVARQIRLILACDGMLAKGCTPKEIESSLGISPYAAKSCLAQKRNFSREELVRALGRVLEADVDLKTSRGDPRTILELCLFDLCCQG